MNVLSIGSDRNVFTDSSAVALRLSDQAQYLSSLHVIVLAQRSLILTDKQIGQNIFLYPTQSSSRFWYVWDGIRRGMKVITSRGFVRGDAVITCQDPFESGFIGFVLSRLYRIPLHVQLHTDVFSPYFANSFLQKLRVWLARCILPRADMVRVVHEDIAKSLATHGISLRKKPQVLPIRVNREYIEQSVPFDFKKNYPQFHVIVLMVNRLNPEKGVDTALRACKEVIKEYPFVGLCIVGDGPERLRLESLADFLGIKDNVIFMGSRTDIGSLLKSAHIFLSTSRFEGYGMTLVEAGVAETPVVTTSVGLARGLIVSGKNGIICKVDDEPAITRGIIELIHYPLKRSEYGKALYADIAGYILPKEEYIQKYIQGLRDTLII